MNKKNTARTLTGLALVGLMGVGATLAYLSDSTGPVTNSFALSTKGISITLDEALKDGSGRTDVGNDYGEVVPGEVIAKDPQVHVVANSLDANVFVKVTNPNGANLTITDLNVDAWEMVETKGDSTYYVYKKGAAPTEAADAYTVVKSSDQQQDLAKVFEHVQVKDYQNSEEMKDITLKPIVIKAAAVQAKGVTDQQALTQAKELLDK